MLIRCLNFSRNRTLFKTLLKQDLNLVQTRNFKLDFWNQPFGYLIKPPPGRSGSKENEAWFHTWAKFNFFIAGILLARLIYKGELQEIFGGDNWWNSYFNYSQEKFEEKEEELDEKSKELLRLVEKANKPFEPLTKLPDWPPPFVAKETQKVPEVPSKKTAQPALLVELTEETVPKNETS